MRPRPTTTEGYIDKAFIYWRLTVCTLDWQTTKSGKYGTRISENCIETSVISFASLLHCLRSLLKRSFIDFAYQFYANQKVMVRFLCRESELNDCRRGTFGRTSSGCLEPIKLGMTRDELIWVFSLVLSIDINDRDHFVSINTLL